MPSLPFAGYWDARGCAAESSRPAIEVLLQKLAMASSAVVWETEEVFADASTQESPVWEFVVALIAITGVEVVELAGGVKLVA